MYEHIYIYTRTSAQFEEPQLQFLDSFNTALEWTVQHFRNQYKVICYFSKFGWIQVSIYLCKSVLNIILLHNLSHMHQ